MKMKDLFKKKKDTTEDEHPISSVINNNTLKEIRNNAFLKGIVFIEALFIVVLFIWNFTMLIRPKNEMTGVITVNALTGEQEYIKNAVELQKYKQDEYIMLNSLKSYITALFSVSSDDGVNKKNMEYVYAYTTSNATDFVRRYYEENNPIKINQTTRHKKDIIIYNAMPINNASGLKFQVDWNEIERDSSGGFVREQNYRADIDCKQYKATKITSNVNPIGFYITNIGISEIKNGFITNIYKGN